MKVYTATNYSPLEGGEGGGSWNLVLKFPYNTGNVLTISPEVTLRITKSESNGDNSIINQISCQYRRLHGKA